MRPSLCVTGSVIGTPSIKTSFAKPCEPLIVPLRLPSETPGNKKINAPGFLGPCPIPKPATEVPIASGSLVYSSLRIVVPSLESVVFNWEGAFSTVTVSLMLPALSVRSTATLPTASTTTPSWIRVWKPATATVSLYVPGGSGVITYKPASVVCLLVSTPEATFVAVTVAPGTIAPVGSDTVPLIAPPLFWATAVIEVINKHEQSKIDSANALLTSFLLIYVLLKNLLTLRQICWANRYAGPHDWFTQFSAPSAQCFGKPLNRMWLRQRPYC